ncbi:MAG TPA: radical SAM protein [Negativicutes bacterium]|nr:radical SAM protein [Negativicutes bacterium]
MKGKFDLYEYLNKGVEDIVGGILKASCRNPRETVFMLKFAKASKAAGMRRESREKRGYPVPAFLISSITSSCNLFCMGCYARANSSCGEGVSWEQLSAERWGDIFREAGELGISFVLLAGGEPLMRRDVIEKAAEAKDIIFPVFTNGTLFNEDYIKLFDENRNLVPILSIEGDREITDDRRGTGTYDILMELMSKFKDKGILFGASVTLTTGNIENVTSRDFYEKLHAKGCKALIFVEYVPVTQETAQLAPTERERGILEAELQKLREKDSDTIFLSFPGDEKYSGGCLAAGRGFFHINTDGAAEPCPFSPYSDTSLKDCTLEQALNSKLFRRLDETGMLVGEHDGGCMLFQKEKEVKALIGL